MSRNLRISRTTTDRDFVIRTAELLHAHGAPAHRLEAALQRLARVLGVRAQFFSSPTSLLLAFEHDGGQDTILRRVEPGGFDLGKLVEFDRVLDELEARRLDVARARRAMEAVAAARPRHRPATSDLAHGVVAAAAAVLFGATAHEAGAAMLVGIVVGLLSRSVQGDAARLHEPLAAFVATLIAGVLARGVVPLRDPLVVLAGLIVLLPGLGFTVAMIELTTRNLLSGAARLAGAATVFVTLAFGVAAGRSLIDLALPPPAAFEVEPMPGWVVVPALLAAGWAFTVLLHARYREAGWICAAAVVGWAAGALGHAVLSPTMGSFVGALGVGLFSNGFARLCDKPATVVLTPGLLVLVPGSVGYRALDLFLAHDALSGMQTAFDMMLAASALVAGLLCANVLFPPRRSL